MLSLDLFDSKFEKKLHEGAVDDAEYARLKKLGEKIDYLKQARAQTKDAEMHRVIDKRIKEYDDERHEILSVRGMKEAEHPQRPPAKGLLKGKDLVTPQQRVAGATPQKPGIAGAVKDVVGGIKRFVKGEPDQGPTFEQTNAPDNSQVPEYRIMSELVAAWKGEQDYVKLPLLDGTFVPLTRPAMFNALVQLNQIQKTRPKKYLDYLQKILVDEDTFLRWLASVKRYKTPPKKKGSFEKGEPVQQTLGLTPPPVQAAEPAAAAPAGPMVDPEFQKSVGIVKERQGQKKKSKQAPVRDAQLVRAIQQARAKFPTAASDMEAFSKDQLEINTQQDKELSDLEQQLQKVQSDNTALSTLIKDLDQQIQKPQVQPKVSAVTPGVAPVATAPAPQATPAAQPVPTELPPVTAEPPEEKPTDKPKTKAKKPRVKKLPAKDMGKADEVPRLGQLGLDLDGDRFLGRLPGKKSKEPDLVDLDLDSISGNLAQQAISRAKQKSKEKVEVEEHGGGIGPKKHWQSMIKNEEELVEGIKDTASATAVIACLLTGGSLQGCATAPQQTSAQQVLKTGQDIGRTVQSAKKITRAGVEAEVNQEIRNIMRGVSGRPEELNHSNILRIWKRIKGQPPVTPEPQAPEYGPAEPVKRPATESKEPTTKQEYDRAVDSIASQLKMEKNIAVRQMLQSQLKVLQNKGRVHGWHRDTIVREDTAALAAEDAILKRIFVKHKDLMMEYGPDKITQAAESVAYNVGDIAHITDAQISEWVGQVEYILGARP